MKWVHDDEHVSVRFNNWAITSTEWHHIEIKLSRIGFTHWRLVAFLAWFRVLGAFGPPWMPVSLLQEQTLSYFVLWVGVTFVIQIAYRDVWSLRLVTDFRISEQGILDGPQMPCGLAPCVSVPNISNSSWRDSVHLCQRRAFASQEGRTISLNSTKEAQLNFVNLNHSRFWQHPNTNWWRNEGLTKI